MMLSDLLGDVAWAMYYFGSIATGRGLPRRDMLKARDNGFVESAGEVAMCDADGCQIEPERWREGWRLTIKGQAKLRECNPSCADAYLGRQTSAANGKDGAK